MNGKGVWLRGGRGREKWWGLAIFFLDPLQFNLSKMERK